MSKEENEFPSLQDAIALVKQEFSEGSNVTAILEAVMKVMITGRYEYDGESLSELEELCR